MSRPTAPEEDDAALIDLQQKALDLRIAKLNSEKEFIGYPRRELSPEQASEVENKRSALFHQLEMDGAQLERQYLELLRSRMGSVGRPGEAGADLLRGRLGGSCWFCDECVTAKCLTCTACQNCILVSSL